MKLIVTASRPSSPDDLARYQKVAAILGPHVELKQALDTINGEAERLNASYPERD